VFACGFCHRATGPGGPENADLASLPKSYVIQQMADYKSGARNGSTLQTDASVTIRPLILTPA
jgi:cytochrome c553